MKFSIITLFPESFAPVLNSSILKRAQTKGLVEFEMVNLRDFGEGIHQIVDDRPYGGGAGMILKADILAKAVHSLQTTDYRKSTDGNQSLPLLGKGRQKTVDGRPLVILTSASGNPYSQKKARELSKHEHIILICGHYEGIDQRFIDKYVDEEISIGDFVLTGGELPAMMIADSITRLLPGVLEKEEATLEESFENGLLEYPHYTRPDEFEGEKVPDVLVSGHHGKVKKWREQKSLEKTKKVRPDLMNAKV